MMYPIKNIRLTVLLFSSVILMLGCNTFEADFERDNPKDPEGSNFTHSSPELFSVDITDGVINISWEDVSSFNRGYIVEKAINDTTDYNRVATLPEDAELYRDDSREIGEVVYYKISSFTMENDEETVVHSETLSLSVEELTYFGIYSQEKNDVSVTLRADSQFSDGVIIQEKSKLDSEYSTVKLVDFSEEPFPEHDYYNYTYKSDIQTFNLDIRVAAFQYRGENREIIPVHQLEGRLNINDPFNFEITFENELETRVEWDNSVDFAEYYLLEVDFEESGNKLSYELQPDQQSTLLDMEMEDGQSTYTLQAIKENDNGIERKIRTFFNIRLPNLRYSSKSLDAVTLQLEQWWEGPVKYSAIFFERSVNGGSYEIIGEIPPTKDQFTDTDLFPENTYSYRIRSLTRGGNNVIELSNKNRLVQVNSVQTERISNQSFSNLHFLSRDKAVYYRTHYSNTTGHDLEIIDLNNMTNTEGFNSGSDYYSSRVSPAGDEVAELVDGDNFGEYDLKIWDLNSQSQMQSISAAHVETSSTDIRAKLRYSRDGGLLASEIMNKPESEIKIWDTETGDLIHTIAKPGENVRNFVFNPTKDEMIVLTESDLYIYDTNTFDLIFEKQDLSNGYTQIFSRLSGDGKRMILFSWKRIFVFDLDRKIFTSDIQFEEGIRQLSTNLDGSELLIETDQQTAIYSTEPFEKRNIIKYNYNSYVRDMIALNSMSEGAAISISDGTDFFSPATIYKWERRDVWYMEPERQ